MNDWSQTVDALPCKAYFSSNMYSGYASTPYSQINAGKFMHPRPYVRVCVDDVLAPAI